MEEMIARALRGDRKAFDQLYDRFAPMALRLAGAVTGSPDLAADAVQEAFLRVYKKGGQCRSAAQFQPWFCRIVINESRRLLEKRPEVAEWESVGGTASFAEQSDLSLTVNDALNRLSPEHRTVLTLKFLLEYNDREIGEILAVPTGTVKSRVHYAKQALARELGGKEGAR